MSKPGTTALLAFLAVAGNQGAIAQAPGEYYVSTQGHDNDPGTLERPFQTIQRARDAVRKRIAAGLASDITVHLRGGTYLLPDAISFGPQDSGSDRFSVNYKAYLNEVPVLVGGVKLTGFKRHSGSIYVAELPGAFKTNQVFENNTRMTAAREPNSGYHLTLTPVPGAETSAFYYDPTDFDPVGWDTSQATIFIWQGDQWQCRWFSHEKPIAAIDTEKHIVRMGSDKGYPMRKDRCSFYFKNILAHLDAPGEVFIDSRQNRIYLWSKGGDVESQTFVAATATNLLTIQGTNEKKVTNLHFEGLDVSIAKEHAVFINDAEKCSLKACKVENAGSDGINLAMYAQGNRVEGCLIQNNGCYGIHLHGDGPSREAVYNNHDNVITNNHIRYCGRLVGHGAGIMVQQSGDNTITHNLIHHMPRYGIAQNGLSFHLLKKQIDDLTLDNQYDYLYSRNNYVAYNEIHHVNLETQDTGALESWCPGRDNVYHNNLIHDSGNREFNIQSGIYLDDASNYFTVTNNIIYNIEGSDRPHYANQCIFAKGVHNTIRNNILIVSTYCNSAITSYEMANLEVNNHRYLNNIICFEPGAYSGPRFFFGFINFSDSRVSASDYNVFHCPDGPLQANFKAEKILRSFSEWKKLFKHRCERHSKLADPLFVDAEHHDYTLRPESPAWKLGFQPIDVKAIGLTADFPQRFERQ